MHLTANRGGIEDILMARKRSHEVDMLNGPILPRVLEFSLPLMLSGMLQLLYNAADIVVVGRFAGPQALAAVGSTGALISLIVNAFFGLSVGASVAIARYYGGGRYEDVRQAVHSSMALAIISGLFVTVVGLLFSEQMLHLMDSPADVLPLAAKYLKIYFLGATANLVYNFGAGILRAIGDTKRPLYYLTISGLVNVVLNLILVIFFHMDVAGVAIATVTSQVLSALLVVICLVRADGCFRLDLRQLRMHADKLRDIVQIGLPAGMQSVLFSISNVLIQSSVNSFGSTVMAGNSAAGNIEGFVYTAMNCFASTCMTFTSQNLGAGKLKRIDPILWACSGSLTTLAIILGFSARFFAEPLLGIYTTDPEVVAMGAIRMTYICLPYFLCGLMDTMAGHLRGLGSGIPPMIISLAGACGFRILWICTIFAAKPNLHVLYVSYPISWGITALVHFAYSRLLKRKIWREYQITE